MDTQLFPQDLNQGTSMVDMPLLPMDMTMNQLYPMVPIPLQPMDMTR